MWCCLSLADLVLISLDLLTSCFQTLLLFKGFLFVANSGHLHIKYNHPGGFLFFSFSDFTVHLHILFTGPILCHSVFCSRTRKSSPYASFDPLSLWSQYLCILFPWMSCSSLPAVICKILKILQRWGEIQDPGFLKCCRSRVDIWTQGNEMVIRGSLHDFIWNLKSRTSIWFLATFWVGWWHQGHFTDGKTKKQQEVK